MLKALTALCADPKNIVWVISGRDQKVLEEWLGHIPNLGFSAEHGSFMRQPGGQKWVNLTESLDMGWKNDVIEIFTYYTERTQGNSFRTANMVLGFFSHRWIMALINHTLCLQ